MTGVTRTTVNGPWWNENSVTNCWRNEKPFTTSGALRGDFNSGTRIPPTGLLPREECDELISAVKAYGPLLFIVWSYETPIAWRAGNYTYKSATKYSVTTSKHQGRIF